MPKSQFDTINNRIKARQSRIARRSILAISEDIEMRTPVDTAMAKHSWFFTEGSPSNEKPETIDRANSEQYKIKINAIVPGEIGYFVNNQPYILKLEYGYSQKSPGMVRFAILDWQNIVDAAVKLENKK